MDNEKLKRGLLILQLFFLSAVFQHAYSDVLTRSILSANDSLLLQTKNNRSSEGVLYDLYSGLLTLSNQGKIEPELALEWKSTNDALSWTFKLREDAQWSDGVPVTAWDFVYAFKKLRSAESSKNSLSSLYQLIKNGRAIKQGLVDAKLLGVSAIDKYTLKINLEKPVSDFLYYLTRVEAMPLPEHAYSMYGAYLGQDGKIINNGPYLLEGSFKKNRFVLKKNPKYFKSSEIKFDKVNVIVENNQNKLLKMFQAGKLDIVEGFDPRQKNWLQKYRPEIVYEMSANGLILLITNQKSKKLEDIRVRKAMSYALDTKIIANRIYKSEGPGLCYLPDNFDNDNCLRVEFPRETINIRVEKAKQLMAEAGYAEKKLKVLLHIDDHPGNREAAAAIINMWKRINIDTVIVEKGVQHGNSDISLKVWASDGNTTNHFILDFIEMVSRTAEHAESKSFASKITDHDLQKNLQLFRQYEEKLSTQYYVVPVSSLQWRYLVRENITGFNKAVNGTFPSRWLGRKKIDSEMNEGTSRIVPVLEKYSASSSMLLRD